MARRRLSDQEKLDRQEQRDREAAFEQMMRRCPHPDAVETKALRDAALRELRK